MGGAAQTVLPVGGPLLRGQELTRESVRIQITISGTMAECRVGGLMFVCMCVRDVCVRNARPFVSNTTGLLDYMELWSMDNATS